MAQTAATLPGTGQSLSTGVAWTTPSGITEDGSFTTYRSSSGNSAQLTGTNFGFAIPSTATIIGILFSVKIYSTYASEAGVFNTVRLKKTSGAVGDNLGTGTLPIVNTTVTSFGGSTNLWGTTWTPAEINSSDFGVYLIATKPSTSGDHYVDYFKITIYYSLPGGALFFAQY